MPSETKHLRCAIYTRKSTEHGLEQEFNSLGADSRPAKPTLPETQPFCRDRKSFNKDRWSLLRRGGAYHRRARGIPTRNKFVDRTHRGCCMSGSMRTIIALQQRQIARGTQQFDPWIVR